MRGVFGKGLLEGADWAQVQTWRQWQRQGLVARERRCMPGAQVGGQAGDSLEGMDRAQVQTWQQWRWRSLVAREGRWMQRG